jgi:hypothetical protein
MIFGGMRLKESEAQYSPIQVFQCELGWGVELGVMHRGHKEEGLEKKGRNQALLADVPKVF